VAVLEKHHAKPTTPATEYRATLHFHEKVTADNIRFRGIHPEIAYGSHQSNLALLVGTALKHLPLSSGHIDEATDRAAIQTGTHHPDRKKLDFISVTRGPGIRGCLTTGLDTAKGLATAFQIPLLAVNHMQAHALTPRLVSALQGKHGETTVPEFPFMSLLVSGGHTMLVHSKSLNDHKILASTIDIAIGDFLDKAARDVVPEAVLSEGGDIMFGRLLEKFVFPHGVSDHNYVAPTTRRPEVSRLAPPMHQEGRRASMKFSFAGLGTAVRNQVQSPTGDISLCDRISIGRDAMRVAFEHLASRVIMALESLNTSVGPLEPISTLVVSGGVASNKFLRTV
jgi:N6-L-threonylcarbamoyladenine synthase